MGAPQQKPQRLGSAYFNVKKGSPQEVVDEVQAAVDFLASKRAYLDISMKKSTGDGYVKMTGFFNGFKRPDHKDPDLIINLSTISYKNEKPAAKSYGNKGGYKKSFSPKAAPSAPPKQEAEDEFASEEVPF